jgi:hypothetical protein
MVFRSHYVDPDVDRALRAHAAQLGATAGSVFRHYLDAGLAQHAMGADLPPAPAKDVVFALRTADIRVRVDEQLWVMALSLRMKRGELADGLVRLGMVAIQAAAGAVEQQQPHESSFQSKGH